MKGMLTGPVTVSSQTVLALDSVTDLPSQILNWSFPRADVSKEIQSKQLALALRDEVVDLANAGIKAIQVDEPAIREGLPLRKADWDNYLQWAVDSFRLSTSGVGNDTQVHSHFCYSDFGDIFPSIQGLDADGASRSSEFIPSEKLIPCSDLYRGLQGRPQAARRLPVIWLRQRNRPGCLRHPLTSELKQPLKGTRQLICLQRVPSEQEIKDRLQAMAKVLPADLLSEPRLSTSHRLADP